MSFLPVFATWEATEIVGTGAYGRVYKCIRKKRETSTEDDQQQQPQQTTPSHANSEDTLSTHWEPSTVAMKMIHYVRESSSSGGGGNLKQHRQPEIPLWFQGASPDLLNGGLEGIKEAAALHNVAPHPCIVRLHSCFFSLRYKALCVVEEWANGPTLGDLYNTCGALTEKMMMPVTIDLLHALLQLHACRLIHRDVKPTNIIMTRGGVAKMADLGVSALVPEQGDYRKTYVGTAGFMAPEVMVRGQMSSPDLADMAAVAAAAGGNNNNGRGGGALDRIAAAAGFGPMSARSSHCAPGEGYNEAADVWSLGVSLLEGAMGQVPAHDYVGKIIRCFTVEQEAEARRMAMLNKQQQLPYDEQYAQLRASCENRLLNSFHISHEFADVLLSMLDPIPARRPTCLKLLTEHPFCVKAMEIVCAERKLSEDGGGGGASEQQKEDGGGDYSSSSQATTSAAETVPASESSSSSSSHDATAVTRRYLRVYNKNAKAYRGGIMEAIARIPQQRRQERPLLVNPNAMLAEATAANDDGDGTDVGARKNALYTNAFRAPSSSNWTLPAQKFIDVVCALDFPAASSSSASASSAFAGGASSSNKTMIGADPATATYFSPVSSADVNVISVGQASQQDLAKAARRVENAWAMGAGSAPASPLGSTMGSSGVLLLQPGVPFGPLFQQMLLPSLDAATMRSARLDTWIEDATATSAALDSGATASGAAAASASGHHALGAAASLLQSYQQQQQQQQRSQTTGEGEASSGGGGAENNNSNNATASAAMISEQEADAVAGFDNLRRILAECEATVPNFSDSFFGAVADISVVDPGACALVSHAFDRGQWVTRHRDGLLHGMALRAPQLLQDQQQQQQMGNTGGGGSSQYPQTAREQHQVGGSASTMPLTGRRSRMGTPRLGMVANASMSNLDILAASTVTGTGGGGTTGNIGNASMTSLSATQMSSPLHQTQPAPKTGGGKQQQQSFSAAAGCTGNIFAPASGCSTFMSPVVPLRTGFLETCAAATSGQQQQQQQQILEHGLGNVAVPANLLGNVRDVRQLMLGGAFFSGNLSSSAGDGNDFSLGFRDQWLSSGSAGAVPPAAPAAAAQSSSVSASGVNKQQQQHQSHPSTVSDQGGANNRSTSVESTGANSVTNNNNNVNDASHQSHTSRASNSSAVGAALRGSHADPNRLSAWQTEGEAAAQALLNQPGMPRITNPAALPSFGGGGDVAAGPGGVGGGGVGGVMGGARRREAIGKNQRLLRQLQQEHFVKSLEAADTLVATGVADDGTVYAPELLFGHEAKAYHSQLTSSLAGSWS